MCIRDRLKAYYSVLSDIKFIPTGGISEENAFSYLKLANVMAVGASALIPSNLIKINSWNEIEDILNKSKANYLKS